MAYFPENKDDWKKIAALAENAGTIFITTHVNPDGDAIGSVMALAGFFSGQGKTCRVINNSKTPELYRFLDPDRIIETPEEYEILHDGPGKDDLVMFLDLGTYSRVGDIRDFLVNNKAVKIVIDHHIPDQIEVDIKVVNTRASSTGSLVFDFIHIFDKSLIDKKIARALMTAIASDTGFFKYSNTTQTTHLIASELYKYGVRTHEVYRSLEKRQPICRQKLMGAALSQANITSGGRIAYAVITDEMFEKAGAQREHTDGIIEQLRVIKGTKVASLIIQEGADIFKASFRTSDNIPANKIASQLGGGGHPKAAGASLNGTLDEVTKRVIDTINSVMDT